MSGPVKIIFHCRDLANLPIMAHAAEYALKAKMTQGQIMPLTYGAGQRPQPVHVGIIKRKTCITVYDQRTISSEVQA